MHILTPNMDPFLRTLSVVQPSKYRGLLRAGNPAQHTSAGRMTARGAGYARLHCASLRPVNPDSMSNRRILSSQSEAQRLLQAVVVDHVA
jgi:hypothetical protein